MSIGISQSNPTLNSTPKSPDEKAHRTNSPDVAGRVIHSSISHSDRLLFLANPEIHRAILRTFNLTRNIDERHNIRHHVAVPSKTSITEEDDDEVFDKKISLLSINASIDSWRQSIYTGNRCNRFLLKTIDRMLTASMRRKLCVQMLRSYESVRKEQRRQIETNRFIIHPFSDFMHAWSLFIILMLALTSIILPLEIAFYQENSLLVTSSTSTDYELPHWEALSIIMSVIFCIDIVIRFRTGHVLSETDDIILDNSSIAIHYLKTWFIIDIISAFPYDVFYIISLDANSMTDVQKIHALRVLKVLRLIEIFRLARFPRYTWFMEALFWKRSKILEMFNIVMTIFLMAHWNGCLQYAICFMEHYPNFPPEVWIFRDGLHLGGVSVNRKYTRCIFRAISQMLAVGYGQGPPVTTSETWVVMASMLIGITLYTLFVAYMARLVASLDYSGTKYDAMISGVKEFMRFHKIPIPLQRRVLNFYDHKYRRKFFDNEKFLNHNIVSPPLRKEILMFSCRHLVRNVSFFKDASTEFIYNIVSRLKFQVYFPREIIVHAGHPTDGMYFIEHGKVETRLPEGEIIEKITEGGYFGEVSLVFNENQETNVVAVDLCDIYCLSKLAFQEVLNDYPQIKSAIENLALIRKQEQKRTSVKDGTPSRS